MSWSRRFDEPIPLPRGRYLVTLEDAGNYITKLPKAEYEAPGMRRIVLTCAILGQMIQHVPDAALQLSHQNKEGRVYE